MSNQFIYLFSFILIPSISILNIILFFLVIFLYIYFRRLDTSLTACWIRLCGLWHLIVRGSLLFLFISATIPPLIPSLHSNTYFPFCGLRFKISLKLYIAAGNIYNSHSISILKYLLRLLSYFFFVFSFIDWMHP